MLRSWTFENGITVEEAEYDACLNMFDVYDTDTYLGSIYPSDMKDYEVSVQLLNDGIDPITDMWSDGRGHTCTIKGWV